MGSSVILPSPGQPKTGADPSFKTASIPNAVTFNFKGLEPPSGLYVQKDDVLQLVGISTLAAEIVTFRVRFLRLELPIGGQPDRGPSQALGTDQPAQGTIIVFERALNITAARTVTFLQQQLGEGFILSVDAVASNATTRGITFARAEIFRGSATAQSLSQLFISDYTDLFQSISWPGGTQRNYLEGPGNVHSLQVANPAAGADWALTVLANQRLRISSFTAQLTASAAVSNRNIEVFIQDAGAHFYWRTSAAASIVASTVQQLSGAGTNNPTGVITTDFSVVLPPGLLLPAGHKLGTITTGLQAGDQWANIWFGVEEWLDF